MSFFSKYFVTCTSILFATCTSIKFLFSKIFEEEIILKETCFYMPWTDILTYMSSIIFMLSWIEHEKKVL